MQAIMARAAAAQTGAATAAAATEELIRVEAEDEDEGDVVWDQYTRCRASPWRKFRNGRQIVSYPPPELPLSPHRAAELRLRMLQQEQHLLLPEQPPDDTSTSTTTARRSVRMLLAAAIVEATTIVTATATLASVHPRSTIQEQGDRLYTPGSSRGGTTKKKLVCRFPGCIRGIKSQGHCHRHGAKVKRCKVREIQQSREILYVLFYFYVSNLKNCFILIFRMFPNPFFLLIHQTHYFYTTQTGERV